MFKFSSSLYDFDWNLLNMIHDKVHLEKDWKIIRVFSKDMHKYFEDWYIFEWNDLSTWMQEFRDDFRFFHSVFEAIKNKNFWYSFNSFISNTIKANHIWIITWRSISRDALKLFHSNIILHYLTKEEQEEFMKNMKEKLLLINNNKENVSLYEIKSLNFVDVFRERIESYTIYDFIDFYTHYNSYFPINNICLLQKLWLKKEDLTNDQKKNLFFDKYFNNSLEYISKLWLLKGEKLELRYSFSDDDEKNIWIINWRFSEIQNTIENYLEKLNSKVKKLKFEASIFYVDSDTNSLFRKYEVETKINSLKN